MDRDNLLITRSSVTNSIPNISVTHVAGNLKEIRSARTQNPTYAGEYETDVLS